MAYSKLVIDGENKAPLSITWTITNRCNYTCSYCNGYKGFEFVSDYKNKLFELNEFSDKIDRLLITGGEATLHPHLSYIIKHSKIPIRLWSNLSKDIKYYMKLKELNSNFIELNTSFHTENAVYYKWSEKVVKLSSFFNIFCNIMHSNILNISNEKLEELKQYAKVNRAYLFNYYTQEPDRSLFTNELICKVNNEPYYFFDRYKLNFKTIAVDCNINKCRINLYLDKYYHCCNYKENKLENMINKKILCSNNNCSGMYLRRGIKKGIFNWIQDGIMR